MKKTLIFLMTTLLFATSTQAQQAANGCNNHQAFRAFDFWIGDWVVTNNANGQPAGTNSIHPFENGCALRERWKGASGSTGESVNYFNPITGKWRQIWLSSGAYMIDFEGGLNAEGAMELVGTIYYYTNGTSQPFKGVWTPFKDGSVRQHMLQHDGTDWQTWFDGQYVRQSPN